MERSAPKRHRPRPTGVSLLDRAVGGVAPALGLVLAGDTGTGRTLICLEVAAAALQRNERVVYLTGEPPEILIRQAESLGLDVLPGLSMGRLTLLELTSDAATTTRAHGVGPLLESMAQEAPHADWMILDPLTALTADLLDERPLRDAVGSLLTGYTESQLIVGAADTDMLRRQPALERALSDVCGSLAYLRRDDEGVRTISVLKSRFASSSSGRLVFTIGAKGTEVVESASVEPPAAPAESASPTPFRRIELRIPEAPDSAAGTGSVRLPSPPVHDAPEQDGLDAESPPVPTAGPRSGDSARVLVIHADPVRADEIARVLSPTYDVSCEHTAFSGLSAIFTRPTALVILDFKLPDISGYEILATLRRAPHGPAVLAVSDSLVRAADRIRALVLGASDVLPSFCANYELLHKVDRILAAPRPAVCGEADVDVQDLLALTANRRQVGAGEFGERIARAHRFGARFGIASSLLALETGSAEDLEVVLTACEKLLRAEDAIHAVDDRHAIALLVAADVEKVPVVLGRLKHSTERAVDLAWGTFLLSQDLCEVKDWSKCLSEFSLEVW